jgi:hypothetical protein
VTVLANLSPKNGKFSQWFPQVGNGSNFNDLSGSKIQLHICINIVPFIASLIDHIYNNIDNMAIHDDQYFWD